MSVANIGKLQENFTAVQDGCEILQHEGHHFAAKSWFRSPRNWPLAWCDQFPMALTPSFQLRITHRLKRWIADFPSFKTTYSMHKLSSRKCSKSGWQLLSSWILHGRFLFADSCCPLKYFMVDFSLLPLLAFMICLWQRTSKLQSFGSSC